MGCSASIGHYAQATDPEFDRGFVILLLGTANCGKTTLLKQMKIIHKNGFLDEERREYSLLIKNNILESMLTIVDIIMLDSELCFKDTINEDSATQLKHMLNRPVDQIDILANLSIVETLLNDPAVEQCMFTHRSSIPNFEAVSYFFNEIERICSDDFIPNNDDILHTRLSTTGVNEVNFDFGSQKLTLVDVGGQKTQRDKWARCFDGVHCLIFCVSLDDYVRNSKDNPNMTALDESLEVFEKIVNNNWFKSKEILIFLNKKDIFENTLNRHPLSRYFADFDGNSESFDDSYKYIMALYLARNENVERNMYIHATCAVDTRNVELVFCVAMDSVLKQGAQQFGLF